MATATWRRDRVRAEVVRLVHRGLAPYDFADAATRMLGHIVPAEGVCMLTLDPATLLPTAEVMCANALPQPARPRLTEIELLERDFNKFADLAREGRVAATLSEATDGDLDRSVRHRELRRPSGFDDELRVILRDAGATWGALTLLRESGSRSFTDTDVRFVTSLSALLAEGVRRSTLLATLARDADGDTDPTDPDTGVLVLDDDETVEMANDAAGRWLDELPGASTTGQPLPLVVRAVARQARHVRDSDTADPSDRMASVARGRVCTRTGRLAVVRGSLLGDGPDARVVVLVEAAGVPELAPLIADAYGLTATERAVTELVARGFSTREIAERLHIAAYTVQDHLKAIFDKSGTRSRGELVARLFFDHYGPTLPTLNG